MPKNIHLAIIAISYVFILGLAQVSVADASSSAPYASGMDAFQQKDYTTACPLLTEAYASRPDDIQLLLNLAICQTSLGQYEEAERSYRLLCSKRPNDARLKFELGRVLTQCCKYDEAQALFQSLKQESPPPELRSNLDTMLDQLDNLKKRVSFGGSFEVSVLNDDNVNVGPDDGTMGNITLDPDTMPKASTGVGYALMLGIDYKLDPKGEWRLSGGLSRNEIWYSQHIKYNVAVTNFSARIKRKLETGMIEGGLSYTDIEQGEMNSINTFSPTIMWMHSLARDKQLITDAGFEFRDNQKTADSSSHYWTAGEYLRWFFGEGNAHYILGGGRIFKENARSPRNSNIGYDLKLAPSFALPWESRLDLTAAWGKTMYNAPPSSLTDSDRRDEKTVLSAAVSRQLWSKESKATLSIVHTINRSNYVPNDYHKNTAKFSLSYSF